VRWAEGWLGSGYGPPGQGKPLLQKASGAKSLWRSPAATSGQQTAWWQCPLLGAGDLPLNLETVQQKPYLTGMTVAGLGLLYFHFLLIKLK